MNDLVDTIKNLVEIKERFREFTWELSEFETWFLYTGDKPIILGDLSLDKGDMFDLTYWSVFDYEEEI